MNPPEPTSENPLPVASFQKSTFEFIGTLPPKNDDLDKYHVSRTKNQNPEFFLSAEEISLIREFPGIMKDFEEIDANYQNILKSIGEDFK